MREIYLFDESGQGGLAPISDETTVDAMLLQAAREDNLDWMVPLFAGGDPKLMYMVAHGRQAGNGGIVTVFMGREEPLFHVIANTNLAFAQACAHFSNMVAGVRYGADIYDNYADEDDD